MDPELTKQREAALRALERTDDSLSALESSGLDDSGRRRALLEVSAAVEASLRRWLRDSEAVPIETRLRAQAADELRDDAVLAELRQHNLLAVESAAAVHELLEVRRRLAAGGPTEPGDVPVARRAAHRLAQELRSPPPPERPAPVPAGPDEETLVHPVPPPALPVQRSWMIAGAAIFLVLILAAVAVSLGRREDPRLAEGIALFRSGDYAEAASRFWRYAEEHPDEATPHLYLARIHRRMGRPELAREAVRTALELQPEDAGAHAELGYLLLESGQLDLAVERFRAAIEFDPDDGSAWIGLVRALRESGRGDAADRVLVTAPERVREAFARESGVALPLGSESGQGGGR